MESVSTKEANKFFATTRYLYQANLNCFDKCAVDFQTKDVSAMEKECALACLKKSMIIYKDLIK
jgi:hypothetical protein